MSHAGCLERDAKRATAHGWIIDPELTGNGPRQAALLQRSEWAVN